jgi:rod shape-determining protein MreC
MAERRQAVSLPVRACVAVGRPLQRAFTYAQAGPRNLARAVVSGPRLVAENERLRRERDEAEAKRTELMRSYLDYRALVQSLGLTPQPSRMEGQAARVIALDTGPSRCRATLGVERPGSIAEGDVVRQAAGLVGRVIKVQGATAEVLLLIDPEAAVAGRDTAHGRDQGIVYPEPALTLPSTRLKMEKIKPISAFPDLRAGDEIESSGLDQVFPSGIPIGRIEQVIKSPGSAESVTAILRPAVDFFRLEYVLVIAKQKR